MARGRGRPFQRGASGNPAGRPRGAKNVMPLVRELVAEAILDPTTHAAAVLRLREVLSSRKGVVTALEFAARVNKEIGQGSGEAGVGGVTINFISNVRPEKLEAARSRALPLLPGPTQNSQETA